MASGSQTHPPGHHIILLPLRLPNTAPLSRRYQSRRSSLLIVPPLQYDTSIFSLPLYLLSLFCVTSVPVRASLTSALFGSRTEKKTVSGPIGILSLLLARRVQIVISNLDKLILQAPSPRPAVTCRIPLGSTLPQQCNRPTQERSQELVAVTFQSGHRPLPQVPPDPRGTGTAFKKIALPDLTLHQLIIACIFIQAWSGSLAFHYPFASCVITRATEI